MGVEEEGSVKSDLRGAEDVSPSVPSTRFSSCTPNFQMPPSSLNNFFQGWLDKAVLLAFLVPSLICYVKNNNFLLTTFACRRLKTLKKKDRKMVLSFLAYTDHTLAILLPWLSEYWDKKHIHYNVIE